MRESISGGRRMAGIPDYQTWMKQTSAFGRARSPFLKLLDEAVKGGDKDKIKVIGDLKLNQSGPVRVMDLISQALPELLWLDRMKMEASNIEIEGRAFNTNAVANFIERLDRMPEFEEPTLKGSYSGPAQGPGARYTFESKRAGCGYTEITGIDAPRSLHVRLVMTRPIACDNRIEFRLAPVSGGTQVTWGMSGAMPFVSKVMNQVIDCEKMCTGQFDRGLAKLKGIVEGERVGGPERVA